MENVPVHPIPGFLEINELSLEAVVPSPKSWNRLRKWYCYILAVCMTSSYAVSASMYTPLIQPISVTFNSGLTATTVGLTLFLFGSCFAPLLFAPLSEIWGRRMVSIVTYGIFALTHLWSALSPGLATLLVSRFVAGVAGSSSVTHTGGMLADLWHKHDRFVPLAWYTAACFIAPVLGPCFGGVIVQFAPSWRWAFWLYFVVVSAIFLLMALTLPETYHHPLGRAAGPGLLFGGDGAISITGEVSTRHRAWSAWDFLRPLRMLVTEPILFIMAFFMAFLYGILYIDITTYPILYQHQRGWSPAGSTLSLLGFGLGMAVPIVGARFFQMIHAKWVLKLGPLPEARLPPVIPAASLAPLGFAWFVWSMSPPNHWAWAVLAGVPFGASLVIVCVGITAYLTECYGIYSASALAACSLLRSLLAGLLPLLAVQSRFSLAFSNSILGIAVILAPIPWIFFCFGSWLIQRSSFNRVDSQ